LAFDQHLAAFFQILVAGFAQFAPGGAAKLGGDLDRPAPFAGALVIRGKIEGRHWHASRGLAHFGIATGVSDEHGFAVLL
jgi:hypothetical protein